MLTAESGITLAQILDFAVPRGFFLPVTPGTKYVTLGGAIANDIHGKNHHVAGTFGNHVTQLRAGPLRRHRAASARPPRTPTGSPPPSAAWASPASSPGRSFGSSPSSRRMIDYEGIQFHGIDEFLDLNEQYQHVEYTVSWVDCASTGKNFARGIFMLGDHSQVPARAQALARAQAASSPSTLPGFAAQPAPPSALSTRVFFHKQMKPHVKTLQDYEPFFYPLDKVLHWNRMYGKRGLLQFQYAIPWEHAREGTIAILHEIAKSGLASFLAVLKAFGDVPSPGMMSFPQPGITLALDFPIKHGITFPLLQRLADMTRELRRPPLPGQGRRHDRRAVPDLLPAVGAASPASATPPSPPASGSASPETPPEPMSTSPAAAPPAHPRRSSSSAPPPASPKPPAASGPRRAPASSWSRATRTSSHAVAADLKTRGAALRRHRRRRPRRHRPAPRAAGPRHQLARRHGRRLSRARHPRATRPRRERDFDVAAQILHTNFVAPVSLLTWLANYCVQRHAGTLAVISSVAGDRGRKSNYVYGSSKAGLTRLPRRPAQPHRPRRRDRADHQARPGQDRDDRRHDGQRKVRRRERRRQSRSSTPSTSARTPSTSRSSGSPSCSSSATSRRASSRSSTSNKIDKFTGLSVQCL